MFRSTTFTSVAVLCVALILALFVEAHRVGSARRQATIDSLSRSSAAAARIDSSGAAASSDVRYADFELRPIVGVGRVFAGNRFAWGGFIGWGTVIWG